MHRMNNWQWKYVERLCDQTLSELSVIKHLDLDQTAFDNWNLFYNFGQNVAATEVACFVHICIQSPLVVDSS